MVVLTSDTTVWFKAAMGLSGIDSLLAFIKGVQPGGQFKIKLNGQDPY